LRAFFDGCLPHEEFELGGRVGPAVAVDVLLPLIETRERAADLLHAGGGFPGLANRQEHGPDLLPREEVPRQVADPREGPGRQPVCVGAGRALAEVPELDLLVEKRGEGFTQGGIDRMGLRLGLGERLTQIHAGHAEAIEVPDEILRVLLGPYHAGDPRRVHGADQHAPLLPVLDVARGDRRGAYRVVS
jgi:hypothetical protein